MGYARGHGVVLDSSLDVVDTVLSQGGLVPNDQHEFKMVDNGKSAIVTVYQPGPYDLSSEGLATGMGWLLNSWFQEVEIGTDRVLFEWSAIDHVPLNASDVPPNTTDTSGTGLDALDGWDYLWVFFPWVEVQC